MDFEQLMLKAVKNREQSSAKIQDMSSAKKAVPKRTTEHVDKRLVDKAVRQQKLAVVQQKLADRERLLEARKKAAAEEKLRKVKQAKPVLPPGPVERNSVMKTSLAYERALLLLGKKRPPNESNSKAIDQPSSPHNNKSASMVKQSSSCTPEKRVRNTAPLPARIAKQSTGTSLSSEALNFNQLMEMARRNTTRSINDLEDSLKPSRKPSSRAPPCLSRTERSASSQAPALLKKNAPSEKGTRATQHSLKVGAGNPVRRPAVSAPDRRRAEAVSNQPKPGLPRLGGAPVKNRVGPSPSASTKGIVPKSAPIPCNGNAPKRTVPAKGPGGIRPPSNCSGPGSSAVRPTNGQVAPPRKVQRLNGMPDSLAATGKPLDRKEPKSSPSPIHPMRRMPNAVVPIGKRPTSGAHARPPANSLREMELRREFLRRRDQFLGEISSDNESDSEEEADGEFDDFIDDSEYVDEEASNEIRRLFKYDPKKYRYIDLMDDRDMEASYGDICREEAKSSRIGLLEDLEEFRKEQEKKKMVKLRSRGR